MWKKFEEKLIGVARCSYKKYCAERHSAFVYANFPIYDDRIYLCADCRITE